MTAPKLARKRSANGPRTYPWPPLPPHELELISVTSAINGGLPKPFLPNWAAKLVAETAVDDFDLIKMMLEKGDQEGAVAHLKGAPYRKRVAAADRGTLVHAALEAYLAGKHPTEAEIEAQMKEARVAPKLWKSTKLMISGLIDFLYDEEPEVLLSESTVYSRSGSYAGTLDLLARMRVGGSVKPVVLDVKTSKAIYSEVAYQLTAYGRADFVGQDDGTEIPLSEITNGEEIEHGIVVRPKPAGGYEKKVFTLGDDRLYERFLAMVIVARLAGIEDEAVRPS